LDQTLPNDRRKPHGKGWQKSRLQNRKRNDRRLHHVFLLQHTTNIVGSIGSNEYARNGDDDDNSEDYANTPTVIQRADP
jgi:hypothetical protein